MTVSLAASLPPSPISLLSTDKASGLIYDESREQSCLGPMTKANFSAFLQQWSKRALCQVMLRDSR
eukprot:scaffold114662_cov17-Prasinocladus_malaysianus.AAC.1